MASSDIDIKFDNTFAREMEGFYLATEGSPAPEPNIIFFNQELSDELGLPSEALNSQQGAKTLSGASSLSNSQPLAQAYAGHQFGGFSPQLGDGRAMMLGEIVTPSGNHLDLQLKGSGRTPFSRGGDGRAALGPVLREYIVSEAMNALGIPTTRALAAVTTGEMVYRDGMQPGAVLTRIASSHIRVGTFQFFAARGEIDKIKHLADYAINRHYPSIQASNTKYLDFLGEVVSAQAKLVSKWMQVGFVHGVMNTDNVTISGETIDYGPCAFMDQFNVNTVFSSIDKGGRYAFGNQPTIAQWNLARFAETLIPLLEAEDQNQAVEFATKEIDSFRDIYTHHWQSGMLSKIGIIDAEADDAALINDLFSVIQKHKIDFTQFFRGLANTLTGDSSDILKLFADTSDILVWLDNWRERGSGDKRSPEERCSTMNAVNPIYIPRNHKVEEALQSAWQAGDLKPAQKLLEVLKQPFVENAAYADFAKPAPDDFGPYKTFCGT